MNDFFELNNLTGSYYTEATMKFIVHNLCSAVGGK